MLGGIVVCRLCFLDPWQKHLPIARVGLVELY